MVLTKGASICSKDYDFMMKQSKKPVCKRSGWNVKENRIYLKFLAENQELFLTHASRKAGQIFVNISRRVKSRNPAQVKSHHQKLLNRLHTIKAIIVYLREQQEVFAEQQYSIEEPYSQTEELQPMGPPPRKPYEPKKPRRFRKPIIIIKDMLRVRIKKPTHRDVQVQVDNKIEILPTSTQLRPYPVLEQSESDDFVFSVVGSEDWPESQKLDRLERIKRLERSDESGASFWSSESFEL